MKKLLQTIVIALALTLASAAFAQQSTDPNSAVSDPSDSSPVPVPFEETTAQLEKAEQLLSGYHGLPDRKVFTQQLDDPKLTLMAIARDDSSFELYRKRALSALGHFADDGVKRAYLDLLQDSKTPEAIRHRLIFLLAEHFPGEALAHLEPFLAHDDLRYRLSAIEAIRKLPGDDAVEALGEAKKSETNKTALKRLEQYTQTVE